MTIPSLLYACVPTQTFNEVELSIHDLLLKISKESDLELDQAADYIRDVAISLVENSCISIK